MLLSATGDNDPSRDPSRVSSADERSRRLAEVFGDVLPDQTRDDTEVHDRSRGDDVSDDWWRAQVPPHHGG